MLLGAGAFGTMGELAHVAGRHCSWQVVAIARTGLALLFGLTLARLTRARLVFFRPATLWMRSLSGSIALVGAFFAFVHLPAAEVIALTNTFPLWVAVLSWPMLGERPSLGVWLAVFSGVAGVMLLMRPAFGTGDPAWLAAAGSSLFSALAMIGLHRLQSINHHAVVVHFSAVSLAFCLAAAALLPGDTAQRDLNPPTLGLLLAIGALATAGQLSLTKAFAAGPPAKVSVVALTQIAFVVIFEAIAWKRSFDWQTILGMALVTAPTAWVLLKRRGATAEELTSGMAVD
jgi:drug/metabolite transporter (DMT)-like permease